MITLRGKLIIIISQPLNLVSRGERYDVVCSVSGGGLSGQAGALRHGLSKALTGYEPELRPSLKEAGLIKRDARRVERKNMDNRKQEEVFNFQKDKFFLYIFAKAVVFKQSLFF